MVPTRLLPILFATLPLHVALGLMPATPSVYTPKGPKYIGQRENHLIGANKDDGVRPATESRQFRRYKARMGLAA
jgi:hypothetical protein